MTRLMGAIYDRIMKGPEDACLSRWREELLSNAEGIVLEVGAGTGANLPYYDADKVARLRLIEPDQAMREQLAHKAARRRWATTPEVTSHELERLPFEGGSFDTVVSTLVLCSVRDLRASLDEVVRVLKPGGRFLFMEHVAAEDDPARYRWQHRIEPLWRTVTSNCHLTRATAREITRAGLRIENVKRESMRRAVPWVRPVVRGMAVRPTTVA